jgi:hypothetical protein
VVSAPLKKNICQLVFIFCLSCFHVPNYRHCLVFPFRSEPIRRDWFYRGRPLTRTSPFELEVRFRRLCHCYVAPYSSPRRLCCSNSQTMQHHASPHSYSAQHSTTRTMPHHAAPRRLSHIAPHYADYAASRSRYGSSDRRRPTRMAWPCRFWIQFLTALRLTFPLTQHQHCR